MCDLVVMGVPSKLIVRRTTVVLARPSPTLLLNCSHEEKSERRKCNWSRFDVYIIRVKRELKRVYRNGCRYNERLNVETVLRKLNLVVYYESIKREIKIKTIYECRCDERLQTNLN